MKKAMPGDGLHAFCRYIPILFVIGPETLVKVRLYRGNIDAYVLIFYLMLYLMRTKKKDSLLEWGNSLLS